MEGKLFQAKLQSWGHADTPLHVASMFGHVDFVREYIMMSSISWQQLCQLSQDGYNPLHLASANGHVEVKKDRDGRTAVHCAAVTGKIDVIDVLVADCPDAAMEVTVYQESVLHLAVKHHQYEAFEFLIQKLGSSAGGLLNLGDREGNTVLHLATAKRQLRANCRVLGNKAGLDVNAGNSYGLRALDITFACAFNSHDVYIEEAIRLAGGCRSQIGTTKVKASLHHQPANAPLSEENRKNEWLKEIRSAIIVMASLVATLAFQVVLTPPGGNWQDWGPNATSGPVTAEHKPGKTILYDLAGNKYNILMYFNSQTFLASIATIVALLRPFRARRWILVQSAVLHHCSFYNNRIPPNPITNYQGQVAKTTSFYCSFPYLGRVSFCFPLWLLLRYRIPSAQEFSEM
ncbi:hypothetical protein Pfo_025501 [Paulownia fortunei]|nr:hypothetical protein Pfo_025501 [Paulownia fortunei]